MARLMQFQVDEYDQYWQGSLNPCDKPLPDHSQFHDQQETTHLRL